MAENKRERISALLDGEFADSDRDLDPVIAALCRDETLKQCWARYELIGDALKNNLPPVIPRDFARRVAETVAQEPPLEPPANNVKALPSPRKKPSRTSVTEWKLAAAVAAAGFVAISLFKVSDDSPTPVSPAVPVSSVVATEPVTVKYTADSEEPAPEVNPMVHRYVVDHEFSTATGTRRGLPPNVRVVSFEARH